VRIRQLTLATGDLEGQAAFYAERLGLPVRAGGVDDEGVDVIDVELRASTIRFRRAEPGLDARYHFAINVPGDAIREAVAWLAERVEPLTFDDDPDEAETATVVRTDVGAGCVYFLDAAGNVVELIASPHLESDGEPFGPGALIEVAEIGIAAADPAATCAALQEVFGEPVYWGGGPDSLLTAIGDHHAVVIVAPTGRGWIPVDLEARPLPTEIVANERPPRELILPEGPYRLRVVPPA
jgi:catechol 2,3-dioxygenase-like lactoylglutathione lyase family enzyme